MTVERDPTRLSFFYLLQTVTVIDMMNPITLLLVQNKH